MEHLVNLVLFMALLASFMAGKRQNALLVWGIYLSIPDIAFGYGDCIAYMQYTSALLQKI